MALTEAALNLMADALAAAAVEVSLHSADPGATGASETSAARQVPAWTTADNGDFSFTAPENFTGGASNGPATHAGLWAAGGVFLGGFALTGDQTFNAAGEYTLNDVTINGAAT